MSDDPVLCAIAAANPHPVESQPDPATDPRAARLVERIVQEPTRPRRRPRRRPGSPHGRVLVPAFTALVALAVVALALEVRGSHRSGSAHRPVTRLVLRMEPTAAEPRITNALADREVTALGGQLAAVAGIRATVVRRGAAELVVRPTQGAIGAGTVALLDGSPRIAMYDWEGDALAPGGRTVAALMRADTGADLGRAEVISQGGGSAAPGSRAAGALSLYRAVRLASREPARPIAATLSRLGRQTFVFAPAGSASCGGSAVPCYLAGPFASRVAARRAAAGPPRTRAFALTVPQGTVLVRATGTPKTLEADYAGAAARFFVLHDDAGLNGADFAGARVTTTRHQPQVDIGLSPRGARAFRVLTAAVAHRGESLQIGRLPSYQHVALAIDGAIVTVPTIDYHLYPDGILTPRPSIALTGGLAPKTAAQIADAVDLGTLPFPLRVVSSQPTSAPAR